MGLEKAFKTDSVAERACNRKERSRRGQPLAAGAPQQSDEAASRNDTGGRSAKEEEEERAKDRALLPLFLAQFLGLPPTQNRNYLVLSPVVQASGKKAAFEARGSSRPRGGGGSGEV